MVCHHCDSPRCFRPVHLFAETTLKNSLDMVAKGRYFQPSPGGNCHWKSKLSPPEVRGIRKLHADGLSSKEIARKFLVSPRTIADITDGKAWRHVTLEDQTPDEIALEARPRVKGYFQ